MVVLVFLGSCLAANLRHCCATVRTGESRGEDAGVYISGVADLGVGARM